MMTLILNSIQYLFSKQRKYSFLFLLFVCTNYTILAQDEYNVKTVVIDAGHGGKDPGAIGASSKEKDITLAVALKLGKMISENHTDVKVIYTRKTDVFIELFERAQIANRNKADLFISIHINSSKNTSASGTEAWVLGLHKTDDNLDVAKRENAVVKYETDVEKNYGFDPNSAAGHIIMTMKQNAFLRQSISLATDVQRNFDEITNRVTRGIKQAGFVVLYKTIMPSTLIELGFISNNEEERYMTSEKGQKELATSIYNAFKKYKVDAEGDTKTSSPTENQKKNNEIPTEEIAPERQVQNTIIEKSITKTAETNISNQETSNQTQEIINPTIAVEEKTEEVVVTPVETSSSPVKEPTEFSNPVTIKSSEPPKIVSSYPVEENTLNTALAREYRIQLLASPTSIMFSHKIYSQIKDVTEFHEGTYYKYLCGKYSRPEDAKARLTQIKNMGYKDAFICIYQNGVRVGFLR